jgi:hypothetical protein
MQEPMVKKATSHRKTEFIDTMDCLPVTELPEGSEWTYEVLCGPQHKISYVAPSIMWHRYSAVAL